MELRHLRYLVAVADAGTFVRAAEQLRVAQPSLTRQLRDLQSELGVELFQAGARRATFTAAGETAVRLARDLIHSAERAVDNARLAEIGLAGRCVVAAGPLAVLSGFAAKLVARIKERYVNIELAVIEAASRQQWEAVKRGRADIGLGVPASREYPTLVSEPQYQDRVDVALIAPDHPLATRPRVTLRDLHHFPFYALADTGSEPDRIKALLVAAMRRGGATDAEAREVAGVDDLLAHVRAGRGWTFLPRLMKSGYAPLVAVSIEDFSAPFQTARIWRVSERHPAVLTVLSELRDMAVKPNGVTGPPAEGQADERGARRYVLPRLELRHVRSFAAVAHRGSFGQAAASRHISQPALSRQMRNLENDLGVRLFERRSRGIDLTPSGEIFRRDVVGLLAGVDRLHKEVKRAERGTSGRCVLGVVPHRYVDQIVCQVLDELLTRRAGMRIEVRSLTTPQLGEALRRSEIDVAISYSYPMPVAQMDGLVRRPLFTDELRCALLAATHPLATRETLSLRDLADVPFLVPRRGVLPRLFDAVMQQFSAAGVVPQTDAEYEGARTIRTLIAEGLGWALGTATQIKESPMGTRGVPLRDFRLPWGAEVVTREDETRPAVLLLTSLIVEAAGRVVPIGDETLPKSA